MPSVAKPPVLVNAYKNGEIAGNISADSGAVSVHNRFDSSGNYASFIMDGGTIYGTSAGDNANAPKSLYVESGCTATWGATSTGISGGDGGGAGGNILSGTGTATTLTATAG